MSKFRFTLCLILCFSIAMPAYSAEKKNAPAPKRETVAPEVRVTAKAADAGPFLPDVKGTKIYAGKKATVTNLEELPEISNNNFRQALVKTPGLMLSEESTPLLSLGYRGLQPHRAQFIQVMKDGVPIHADMFGYPEAYYVPPFQTVEQIEFIRGGAGLMYGPQPGGALNFVTHQPVTDRKAVLLSENLFGSDKLFSTYEALTGTLGPLGYYGYFHERQGDGFRAANSDFEVISSGLKTTLNQTGDSRLTLNYDEYHEEHGEPGGLTRAQWESDPEVATRQFDRFRLERYYGNIRYEKQFEDHSQFDFLVYGGHYRRYSKRQNGGGFGTVPTGSTNSIEEQDFYNLGFEPRLRHNYELFGETHTLTVGTHTFMSHSPRTDQTGATRAADSGTVVRHAIRDTWYFSAFLENLFRWGKLSVTPGVRLENIWQRIHDKRDTAAGQRIDDKKHFDFAPLFGLGLAYEVVKGIEAYTNISQSYRPKIFTEAVPTGANQVISSDLEEGHGVQYDFGLRGRPLPFLTFDVNYFLLSFEDQIGTVSNVVQNVGRARHHGIEFFTEVDWVGAYDHVADTKYAERYGSLSTFFTMTLLDAEFSAGTTAGRAPQYTPQYNLRFGTTYKWRDRFKASLMSTFVDEHFADDASSANFYIPSYKVWDLTAEINLLKDVRGAFDLGLFAGINNLFDEKYYARVRSDGIDPAYGRNVYGGVKVKLG